MSGPNLRVDESALHWDPAEVTVPGVPAVAAGGDPMSVLISNVMPGIAEDVTTRVAGTHGREVTFSDNLTATKTAYQNTDGAGQQDIQAAGEFANPGGSAAGGPPAGGPTAAAGSGAGQAGQLGQLGGMPMQMAGQAAQIPMQMMGAAAAVPQGITQGVQSAVQQVGQMSGMAGEFGGSDDMAEKMNLDGEKPTPQEPGERERAEDGARAGNAGGERVPQPEHAASDEPAAAPEQTDSAEFPAETVL